MTAKTEAGRATLKRPAILAIILGSALAILLLKILIIQTTDFDEYKMRVSEQMTGEKVLKAERGNIYDSKGALLATDVKAYRVFISPKDIIRHDKEKRLESGTTINKIASDLPSFFDPKYGVEEGRIKEQMKFKKSLDRTVARAVDAETYAKIRKYAKDNGYAGLICAEETSARFYPQGKLASHLLGFTDAENVGMYGLEYRYDAELGGKRGKYIRATNPGGGELPFDSRKYIPPEDGHNITTTVNTYVQKVLEEEIAATLDECKAANRACGIIMDVKTGGILAMATAPSFDPNDPRQLGDDMVKKLSAFAKGSEEYEKEKIRLLTENWSNKAVNEIYYPGSTFKIITASIALEEKLVEADEKFYCPGYCYVGRERINCHKYGGHGYLTLAGGLQQSCNPVMVALGERIGGDTFYDYVERYGYLEKTGIDLPGEGNSVFFKRDNFKPVDLAVASFGQQFQISAIQHITAIAAVANGGYLVEPYIVSKITDREGNTVYEHGIKKRRQVLSAEVCAALADIIEKGVSGDGGGKNAYVPGYRVAAKTGTSEKIRGDINKRICSCVAYAPADDPKVALIIVVDEPTEGTRYGSTAAAPYTGNIMKRILPYLGVEAVYGEKELEKQSVKVPNLTFWDTEVAMRYASDSGLNIDVRGDGKYIVRQSPEKGVSFEKTGGKIILYTTRDAEEKTVKVPDVRGRTAAAASGILIEDGFNVKINGTKNYLSGKGPKVISQSPAGGETAAEGSVVVVTLRYTDDRDD